MLVFAMVTSDHDDEVMGIHQRRRAPPSLTMSTSIARVHGYGPAIRMPQLWPLKSQILCLCRAEPTQAYVSNATAGCECWLRVFPVTAARSQRAEPPSRRVSSLLPQLICFCLGPSVLADARLKLPKIGWSRWLGWLRLVMDSGNGHVLEGLDAYDQRSSLCMGFGTC